MSQVKFHLRNIIPILLQHLFPIKKGWSKWLTLLIRIERAHAMGGYVFRETANIPPHTLGLKSIFSPESSSLQSHLHLSSMVRASEIERSVFSPALYHHISVSIHLISLSSYNSHLRFLIFKGLKVF